MVGVMALLIALALMTGLQGELRDRIVGSAAHVYVMKAGGITDAQAEIRKLLAVPRVLAAAPIVQGKALLTSDAGGEAFIEVKGVVPAQEKTVTQIEKAMVSGGLDALNTAPGEMATILIGRDLAANLKVRVGDVVRLMTPEGTMTPVGPMYAETTVQGRRNVQPWAIRVRLGLRVRPAGCRGARSRPDAARPRSSSGWTTCSRPRR